MAKKRSGNKTQAVADYLAVYPDASRKEVVEALRKQGITITPTHVGNIKSKLKQRGAERGAAAVPGPASAAVLAEKAVAVEQPAVPGAAFTLQQIRKVAAVMKALGGFQQIKELLKVVREVGGVETFEDLAEALSGSEVGVVSAAQSPT